jgi:hypothetical protein
MNQLLLPVGPFSQALRTNIERNGAVLSIPEGLYTIPCTHGLHRFPGKFIPNLPRYFLRTVLDPLRERQVCDPFCGSGTTLVEAALEGREFVGMDVDPLAVLVTSAKITLLTDDDIRLLETYWRRVDYHAPAPALIPNVPNLRHWFSDRCISQLSAIKNRCLALDGRARQFSLVVFSSIIRRVSNADDQTQKTYVSHTLRKNPPQPKDLFAIFLERALNGMREYASFLPRPPQGEVKQGDARYLDALPHTDIITSPPYVDSVDYVYNQMLEYFWLLPELGLRDLNAYRSLRKTPMGFRSCGDKGSLWVTRLGTRTRERFAAVHSAIAAKSTKEATNLRTFFADFALHADAAFRALSKGSRYICVIGESVIRDVRVPTVDLMRDLLMSAGFVLKDQMHYEIRRHYMKFPRRSNSGKIKQDHIMVFQK